MIERLILATVLLAIIPAVGVMARRWFHSRNRRLASRVSLYGAAGKLPQVVSFYGPGCGACHAQKRIIDQLQLVDANRASVRFVDAVAEPEFARRFGVLMVPTTVIAAADGRIVNIASGLLHSEAIAELLGQAD